MLFAARNSYDSQPTSCRYEKQLEQEEQAYQQQRRRLYSDVQEEKDRLADQMQKLKQETTQEKSANEVIKPSFSHI